MKVKYCQGCRYFVRMYRKAFQKTRNGIMVGVAHSYGYCGKHEDRVLNIKSCKSEGWKRRINTYDCAGCVWSNCKYDNCLYCPNYDGSCHCLEKVKEGETECPYFREVKK